MAVWRPFQLASDSWLPCGMAARNAFWARPRRPGPAPRLCLFESSDCDVDLADDMARIRPRLFALFCDDTRPVACRRAEPHR